MLGKICSREEDVREHGAHPRVRCMFLVSPISLSWMCRASSAKGLPVVVERSASLEGQLFSCISRLYALHSTFSVAAMEGKRQCPATDRWSLAARAAPQKLGAVGHHLALA